MGHITETFTTWADVLLSTPRTRQSTERDIFHNRFIKPLLPAAFRTGMGQIVDMKDRVLGPFDIVGCTEAFPPFGDELAAQFLMDGVAFCIQVRNWKDEDLTQFAAMAAKLKAMIRKPKTPVVCAVVGFETLPAQQVSEFLKSSAGQPIDGVLSIGQHLILRNNQGWYGNPKQIPFVTEKGRGESLKGFAFWLTHIMQSFVGVTYQLGEYQHL